jgi:hypothetical protein
MTDVLAFAQSQGGMHIAKTRIAVTGVGAIGVAHARILQQSPTCELSAIVDPAPDARAIAEQAAVPLYRSLDELFERDRPDGVILATPNQLHLEHTLSCIQAGVPILLEKPIASTVQDGERIVEEVDKAGATLLIGHHRAHSPIMACAKRLIDEGRLGRIVAVMGSAVFFKPDHYSTDAPWRREIGAGPVLINMIHEVRNLRMLCGEIVAVQAFSSHAKVSGRRYRRDQRALCERRSRHLHVIGHRCLRAQLGADFAREQGLFDISGRRLLRGCWHLRFAFGADHALKDLSEGGGPVVVQAVPSLRGRHDTRGSAQSPNRTFRPGRAWRG